jgi:serine/threonine protein kinase
MPPTDASRAEQARADSVRVDKLIGEVLASRYQIEARLGEGAMGSVYKAKHVKVGRPFAVKVLHPRLLEDDKTLQRFEREAELAGKLHHPNVIGVVDVGETSDGLRYMVMDFAEGHDLASLLVEAPMTAERVIHLTRQMLEGLYHAHEEGLIHRDFKPENVIVEHDTHGREVPRIVDFGIAILREGGQSAGGVGRLTTNGLVLGTPHYMAPEQAVNDPIDHRIDLFALGIMIYEMLCGKLPFDGHGAEVARANLMLDPPRIADRVPFLEVDPLLEAFARKLMEKRRENRPATAKLALELLDLIVADREAAAALLGVPSASTRAPMKTELVQPRRVERDSQDALPPSTREAEVPVQAPTMTAVAVRAQTLNSEPISGQSDLAVPARPKHRTRLIVGALAAALASGVVFVAMHGGEATLSKGAKRPSELGNALALTEPKPALGPEVPAPPPITEVVRPVAEPPPDAQLHSTSTKVTAPKVKSQGKPQLHTAAQLPSTNVVPPTPTKPGTKVEPLVTQPAETKQPALPAVYDSNAFRAQWVNVGAELRSSLQANSSSNLGELQAQYSAINFMSAASSQANREAARKTLDKIHAQLAAQRK